MNSESLLSAVVGFLIGCGLCYFVNPHKIDSMIYSRQKLVRDLENSDAINVGVDSRMNYLINGVKVWSRCESRLPAEIRNKIQEAAFWNELSAAKKSTFDEMEKSLHSRHLDLIATLQNTDLAEILNCYRTPGMTHLRSQTAQRAGLIVKHDREANRKLSKLAVQYYLEHHPETKIDPNIFPPDTKE